MSCYNERESGKTVKDHDYPEDNLPERNVPERSEEGGGGGVVIRYTSVPYPVPEFSVCLMLDFCETRVGWNTKHYPEQIH